MNDIPHGGGSPHGAAFVGGVPAQRQSLLRPVCFAGNVVDEV